MLFGAVFLDSVICHGAISSRERSAAPPGRFEYSMPAGGFEIRVPGMGSIAANDGEVSKAHPLWALDRKSVDQMIGHEGEIGCVAEHQQRSGKQIDNDGLIQEGRRTVTG